MAPLVAGVGGARSDRLARVVGLLGYRDVYIIIIIVWWMEFRCCCRRWWCRVGPHYMHSGLTLLAAIL